jgi:peroxiredoxin
LNKENFILIALITLCLIFVLGGISLNNTNNINSKILEESIQYLKLISDPSVKTDGTTLIGTQFYNFNLKDLDGTSYRLSSIDSLFKIIIIFSIDDCASCLNEYRLWSKMHEKFPANILTVFAICTSREKQAVKSFKKNRKIEFPILLDPERKVKSNMKFRVSPLRILLDQKNDIIEIERTLTTTEHQQYFIEKLDSMVDSLFIYENNKQ